MAGYDLLLVAETSLKYCNGVAVVRSSQGQTRYCFACWSTQEGTQIVKLIDISEASIGMDR